MNFSFDFFEQLVLAVVLAVVAAAPSEREVVPRPPAILRSTSETQDDGSYKFRYVDVLYVNIK
jgi:hypothetical protein